MVSTPAKLASKQGDKGVRRQQHNVEPVSDSFFAESLELLDLPGPPPTETSTPISSILLAAILALICLLSFAIRLFAVVRWESVIHEFDPYFNFRATKFLSEEGFYSFLNWQDDRTWYPIGRVVGGTIYPGLMMTASGMQWILNALNISINVRNMCVFLAPLFAANTALATYLLTKEVTSRSSTALIAAAMVGIVPSYISRSVAGSYDNEGVAIFALIFTFYLWVKAVVTGRLFWSVAAALGYFYMVAAWGGYVFIINIIPIYVVVMIAAGRYSNRLYIAYSVFYTLGSLMAMQVPFVGFNAVKQAESAASHGVFIMIQLWAVYNFLSTHIPAPTIRRLFFTALMAIVAAFALTLIAFQLLGWTQWSGRSLTLLDPTYAKKYIPIIASVSEHQPTSWTSFFFDLHIAVPFAPVGLFFLFQRLDGTQGDARIFMIIYGTISWYFAGVMVRLMLTLAPAACILGAIGISGVLNTFSAHLKLAWQQLIPAPAPATAATSGKPEVTAGAGVGLRPSEVAPTDTKHTHKKAAAHAAPAIVAPTSTAAGSGGGSVAIFPAPLSLSVLIGTFFLLAFYSLHATYVSSEAYSSPSIVLASKRPDGSRLIMDDFREAYYWLRHNTADDAKVMSWWDYGYQMSGMANRTVYVDNNTWNNTHIATVGRAMSTSEEESYPVMHSLDVDYLLVIFGGMTGYQSDDINKFLWMVRIGGGVFPTIKESDYFAEGQFRMDKGGSPAMLNSLLYKMCYYRFDEVTTQFGRPMGYDLSRNVEVGVKKIAFTYLEEVFTSDHWIVRIFKRHAPPNRDGQIFNPIQPDMDRFGRRPEALAGKQVRPRHHLPVWSPGSNDGGSGGESRPAVRYVGCYRFESSLPPDKVYGGGSTGAYLSLARAHAVTHGKRYLALARHGNDGHSFSFNGALPAPDATGGGCDRPCMDEKDYGCGCSDAACPEPLDGGHNNIRRWAVYEVVDNKDTKDATAATKASSSGSKGAVGKRSAIT